MLGASTDPYQPVERQRGITRRVLEVLDRFSHPVAVITKSNLVLRDLDVLVRLASRRLALVALSVTSLDRDLARRMEPRAATPERRLQAIAGLALGGVPAMVMVAPLIPGLTDRFMEDILGRAHAAGACSADYLLLRLPHEVKDLFAGWLGEHFPERAAHVLSIIRQCHGGRLYDSTFGHRMRGRGVVAELMAQRFALATRRLGLARRPPDLDLSAFSPPGQLSMF